MLGLRMQGISALLFDNTSGFFPERIFVPKNKRPGVNDFLTYLRVPTRQQIGFTTRICPPADWNVTDVVIIVHLEQLYYTYLFLC